MADQNEEVRIKDLTEDKYKGFMALDNADGTGKFNIETLFRDIAGIFNPLRTSDNPYLPGDWVMYQGSLYNTLTEHYGDWDSTHFYGPITIESRVKYLVEGLAPVFNKDKVGGYLKGSFVTHFGALYRGVVDHTGDWDGNHFIRSTVLDVIKFYHTRYSDYIKNKFALYFDAEGSFMCAVNDFTSADVSNTDKKPFGIVDWLLPIKCIIENEVSGNFYLQYGGWGSPYDPYDDVWGTKARIRTGFAYSGKNGCNLTIDYGSTNLILAYVFYFKLDKASGLLKYSHSTTIDSQEVNVAVASDYVFSLVFRYPGGNEIPATDFDLVKISSLKTDDIKTASFLQANVFKWAQGGIMGDGSDADPDSAFYDNRIKTYYMEVNGSVEVKFDDDSYNMRLFVYDSSKVFESWSEFTASPLTSDADTGKFLRFCLIRKNNANITPDEGYKHLISSTGLSGTLKSLLRPLYDGQVGGFLTGKKVVFIGDSITAGAGAATEAQRYVNQFGAMTGATVVNLGVNGTCIANNTKNGQSANRFVTRATSANLSDADLVVVFGGTNDLSYDSKAIGDHFAETTITASGNIGTKQLGAISDTDTFAGALHDLVTTIQGNVPVNTPILFLTPLHRNNNVATNPNSYQCNSNGDFMIDFVNAIKDICSFYAIPVLDMYSDAELNPLVPTYSGLFGDGLHPNAAGHKVIAERIASFVKENISFI